MDFVGVFKAVVVVDSDIKKVAQNHERCQPNVIVFHLIRSRRVVGIVSIILALMKEEDSCFSRVHLKEVFLPIRVLDQASPVFF